MQQLNSVVAVLLVMLPVQTWALAVADTLEFFQVAELQHQF
jgi:hypothetical protein